MDEWGPVPGLQGAVVTAGRVPGGGFMGGRLWRMGQVWVPPTPTKWEGASGRSCTAAFVGTESIGLAVTGFVDGNSR